MFMALFKIAVWAIIHSTKFQLYLNINGCQMQGYGK